MKKHKLSKDWILINSKSHPDKVYYYNTRTRKSTWKEPIEEDSETCSVEEPMAKKRKINVDSDLVDNTKVSPSNTAQNNKFRKKKQIVKQQVSSTEERETPQMLEIRRKLLTSSSAKNKKHVLLSNEKKTKEKETSHKPKISQKIAPQVLNTSENQICSKSEVPDVTTVESTCEDSRSSTPKNEKILKLGELTPQMKAIYERLQRRKSEKKQSKRLDQPNKIDNDKPLQIPHTEDNKNKGDISPNAEISKTIKTNRSVPQRDSSSSDKTKKLRENITSKLTQVNKVRSTPLRKNIAKERMDKLRKNLDIQNRNQNIGQCIHDCEKLLQEIVKDKETSDIYESVNLRHKNLRRRLRANKTVSGTTEQTVSKNNFVNEIINSPVYEDMDWEPMEDEKIMLEVQAARTQLFVDNQANQRLSLAENTLELPLAPTQEEKKTLYVVIDTNVFLSNIQIIEQVRDAKFQIYDLPILVIPWTVIRELDYLKDDKSGRTENLRCCARKAIQFINEHFSSKHPRVLGQTLEDVRRNKEKFVIDCPDDEILHVCLQIQNVEKDVVLLSYDKNLCTKAMIHDILTISRDDSLEKIDRFVINSNNNPAVRNSSHQSDLSVDKELHFTEEIFTDIKTNMTEFLSHIVGKEMKELYGDNWAKYTIIEPPWDIKSVLKCSVKHWLAAVSEAFNRKAESILKELLQFFSHTPGGGKRLEDIRYLLEKYSDLTQLIKVEKYEELMTRVFENINELQKRYDNFEHEKSRQKWMDQIGVLKNPDEEEQRALKVFKYLDEIYIDFRDFCGMAAEAVGMPCSFFYESRNPPHSIEDLKKAQPEVAANVNRLLHALSTALEQSDTNNMNHKALIAFYHVLMDFSPKKLLVTACDLSPLDVYCCLKRKADTLRNGLVQLQELSTHFCRMATYRCT